MRAAALLLSAVRLGALSSYGIEGEATLRSLAKVARFVARIGKI